MMPKSSFAKSKLPTTFMRLFSGAASNEMSYDHLKIAFPSKFVAHVQLNRPEKRNALNRKLWAEIGQCFNYLADNADCRSIVVSGNGKCFSAGIDLADIVGLMEILGDNSIDVARKGLKLKRVLQNYQDAFTAIEKCQKPVLAAVHGLCLGGALGLLSATDIRYSTSDALFQIKEVDLGIAADVGHLQRLPKISGNESLLKELTFTARMFNGDEAARLGLVSRLFTTADECIETALYVASNIANKSPVAVQGSKVHLNYSRDHSIEQSLDYIAVWNMTMLQSEDLLKAAAAIALKQQETVDFEKF